MYTITKLWYAHVFNESSAKNVIEKGDLISYKLTRRP